MATVTAAVLNPEPSLPEERAAQHLPPKSYADAAEQTPPSTPPDSKSNGISTLKVVMPSVPEEFAGSGTQYAPPSPTRGEKRVRSKPSDTKANVGASNGGLKAKKRESESSNLVQEKYLNTNGRSLTGIKPSDDYEDELRQDKLEEQKKYVELVSGRKAGSGWDRSSIRWAPLNVPLKRRLQTAMVLFHTLSIAIFVTFFFWLCAVPLFWPIILPYLIYVLFSRAAVNGLLNQRSETLRKSSIWSLFASYFPARLHRSQELPATRKYIFGYHPHGIISHGAFVAFGTEALGFAQLFPGITNTLLTLDSNFRIPLYRDYLLRLGLASVSRESCENLLTKGGPNREGMGRAITIVVGGARESLEATPRKLKLVLGRRKGFVKLAIRTGADLVPVLAFGENDMYEQVSPDEHPWIRAIQLLVKKWMGFTVPLFHARGIFNYDVGLMPYRRPVNIVVGKPIMVEISEQPDPAYVEEMHAAYVAELKRMWDDWKDVFAPARAGELEIIE